MDGTLGKCIVRPWPERHQSRGKLSKYEKKMGKKRDSDVYGQPSGSQSHEEKQVAQNETPEVAGR